MLLIGLTGSIATGKSHAARIFRAMDVPVFDADQAVHRLLGSKGAAAPQVAHLFPCAMAPDGSVDRAALGRLVFDDRAALAKLEAIVHPRVRQAELTFLRQAASRRTPLVVLDIPLLFETGGERRVDYVVAVGCSEALQEERALRRRGMTTERLQSIRKKQLSTPAKRRRSELFLPSGYDRGAVQRQLVRFVDGLHGAVPLMWPDRYLIAAALRVRRNHA